MSGTESARVGGYELLESLGKGTAGTVYLARQAGGKRLFALKVLRAGAPPEDVLRFQREARLVGRLRHPGIVRCFDAGFDAERDRAYLVMEYVPGETLARRLRRGALEPPAAVDLVAAVAEAAAFAHGAGIVHRDLKPANVLLQARTGRPMIVDFGLAREVGGGTWLTRAGEILGTPYYMAPEQLDGERADERTDVYALGVILYELLAGRRPFTGKNVLELGRQIRAGRPEPPTRCRSGVSPTAEAACLRAMAVDPADRWPSARELLAALQG